MSDEKKPSPETIIDLLRALEKSRELRPVARECGLTVRELRKRLARWRRDVAVEASGLEIAPVKRKATAVEAGKFEEALEAAKVKKGPLPAEGAKILEIYSDGASKGNPGPASIGIVFRQKGGPVLCTHSEAIGKATNNVAEYSAVIRAMEFVEKWDVDKVVLHVDSELVARQLTGRYRVKSLDLRPLYQQVVFLARHLKSFQVKHVPREKNAHADHLANLALAKKKR